MESSKPEDAKEAQKEASTAHDTPMMRQWSELKSQASSSLLFFRLGDFYELFGDDAKQAAPLMNVVLTSRNAKDANAIPLCGVPLSQFEHYVSKVLDAGWKVALAEQTEEPKPGKSLVRREIVQWLTPGMRFLPHEERPHYIAALSMQSDQWVLVAADVGTGDLRVFRGHQLSEVVELIERLPIEDLRTFQNLSVTLPVKNIETIHLITAAEAEVQTLQGLNLVTLADAPTESKLELQILGSLLKVIADAHPRERLRFRAIGSDESAVMMSAATRKNLNLFEPAGKSLFDFMNQTTTAFGRRELKRILAEPTQNRDLISHRQTLVQFFKTNSFIRKKFRERLRSALDFHRLLRGKLLAKQIFRFHESLKAALEAIQVLGGQHPTLERSLEAAKNLTPLSERLQSTLQWSDQEDAGWIQSGVLSDLDELRALQKNAGTVLAQIEESMRAETKISTLKVKFHQVFGYVFEVTATHKDKVPASARRIQTLANAERFKTTELQAVEEKLLSLESRVREAESAEIKRLAQQIEEQIGVIESLVDVLSELDAAQSLAEISATHGWTTPVTSNSAQSIFDLKDGVHPLTHPFVPLSFVLDSHKQSLILLTGPNMAGKSTLMRVSALCALLHQIGSDVPAQSFEASLFDRIMCRMGAQDDLVSGQSTFFVEMKEVSQMIQGASAKSFLLFDEIGRGTSTFDGMALAWAITEAVHDLRSLGIIATHYLEMAALEDQCARLKAYHLGVEESKGQLLFTRRLQSGPASRSYGIQVARLAQLPEGILRRAQERLQSLEEAPKAKSKQLKLFQFPSPSDQS